MNVSPISKLFRSASQKPDANLDGNIVNALVTAYQRKIADIPALKSGEYCFVDHIGLDLGISGIDAQGRHARFDKQYLKAVERQITQIFPFIDHLRFSMDSVVYDSMPNSFVRRLTATAPRGSM